VKHPNVFWSFSRNETKKETLAVKGKSPQERQRILQGLIIFFNTLKMIMTLKLVCSRTAGQTSYCQAKTKQPGIPQSMMQISKSVSVLQD